MINGPAIVWVRILCVTRDMCSCFVIFYLFAYDPGLFKCMISYFWLQKLFYQYKSAQCQNNFVGKQLGEHGLHSLLQLVKKGPD